jgi:hypothetical protein
VNLFRFVAAACVASLLSVPVVVSAQALSANGKAVPDPGITLKVSAVISRWEGDKKVGSSPFVLMVVPSYGERAERGVEGDRTTIQMGSEYPLPAGTLVDGKPTTGITYKTLGTNISSTAKPAEDGKYVVYISVSDSQVAKSSATNQVLPSFQTFRTENKLAMRDGQTTQYTVATDAITGQVIKLDVTLNVIK